jgi:NAD(P)-dependent dehydrogenase (short-subunit alcohol dehydrogenase family)
MQITLPGKVGLVTGGGSGIGRAIALGLAAAGAAVAVVGRRPAPLAAVVAEIQAAGGEALAIPADVSRSSDVAQAVAATASTFGGLDILVNNAGFSPSGRITDITEADWDECLAVNLRSVFLAARAAVPLLQQRRGGVILSVAGTFGLRAAAHKAAYSTAKAGVINLTRAIALDYGPENIRCNVICPGYVDTPLTAGVPPADRDAFLAATQPLPGVIQPAEIAALAVYLASDAARMVTGQVFVVDGGQQAGLYKA